MDRKSIDNKTKHVLNVLRIQSELSHMSDEQIYERIELHRGSAATRWEGCQRSFTALFSHLNNGVKHKHDVFDIKLKHEVIDNTIVETRSRLQRSKDNSAFSVRPYAVLGSKIVDQTLGEELFTNQYRYQYGTYRNQSANIFVDYDGNETSLYLSHLNGQIVEENNLHNYAVFLAAIEDVVLPEISSTEDTLVVLWQAVLDKELNPEHAHRMKNK